MPSKDAFAIHTAAHVCEACASGGRLVKTAPASAALVAGWPASLRRILPALLLAAFLVVSSGCHLMHHDSPAVRQSALLSALSSTSVEARVAALEDLETLADEPLPIWVGDLVQDNDPRVRRAALAVVAARNHPAAFDLLATALDDPDVQVRMSAVAGLGKVHTDASRRALDQILQGETEALRAAAVTALAAQGAVESVRGMGADKAWRVRLAVAETLMHDPTAAAAAVAVALAADRSPQVQQATVAAIADWPVELAAPVLFAAAQSTSIATNKLACDQLAVRLPAAAALAKAAPAGLGPAELAAWKAERQREIVALRERWIAEHGNLLPSSARAAVRDFAVRTASPQSVARAEQFLVALSAAGQSADAARAALEGLRAMNGELPAVLDQWIRSESRVVIPDAVYTDVLPKIDPTFATIQELASPDLVVRRRAASRLAELAAKQPLAPSALARIATLVEKEQDGLLWQCVIRIMEQPDAAGGSPASRRVLQLAFGHASPDIRRRACQCAAEWRDPQLTPAMAACLKDAQSSVVAAAVEAMAEMGPAADPTPLVALLGNADKSIALNAAAALAKAKRPEGRDALERLASNADATYRRRAALAMGKTADASFIPTLVRLLDDRTPVRQAALESLATLAGHDYGRADAPSATIADQVAHWKTWHETQVRR
jgi:HEAT repeat protein